MRKILLIILALVLVCTAPALAGTCTIRGTVTDADGSPVRGALVTLFDGNRAEVTTVETDAGGNFAFVNARVDTEACTVRAFYNDGRQTYTNAAYFTQWYSASGDRSIPGEDTRLGTLRLSGRSPPASRPPLSPTGLSTVGAALAFALVAAMGVNIISEKREKRP